MEFIYNNKIYPCSKYTNDKSIKSNKSLWSNYIMKKISTIVPKEVYLELQNQKSEKEFIIKLKDNYYQKNKCKINRATLNSNFKDGTVGITLIVLIIRIAKVSKSDIRSIKLNSLMG